jgi:hypothetical protein
LLYWIPIIFMILCKSGELTSHLSLNSFWKLSFCVRRVYQRQRNWLDKHSRRVRKLSNSLLLISSQNNFYYKNAMQQRRWEKRTKMRLEPWDSLSFLKPVILSLRVIKTLVQERRINQTSDIWTLKITTSNVSWFHSRHTFNTRILL